MQQEEVEIHLIKTIIFLKKVTITVRFPCSISFALKNQHNIIEHRGIHQLKKGECIINQPIQMEIETIWRRGAYEDKKLVLQIFMISVNGKIPAGSVTLNAVQKILIEKRTPLQKCPDKNAQVIFTQNFQLIDVARKVHEFDSPKLTISHVPPIGRDYLTKSKLNYSSSTKNIFMSEAVDAGKGSPRTDFGFDSKSHKYQRVNKDLKLSGIDSSSERGRISTNQLVKVDDMRKRSIPDAFERQNEEFKASRVSSQFLESQEEEIQVRRSRISKLQQDKAAYMKKIDKIQENVRRVDSEQKVQLVDELGKARHGDESFEEDGSWRQKIKIQDRRQRQSNSQLKELREELDKRKSKIMQLDTSRVHFESQIGQKDKMISQLTSQKKKLQDQLQEEKALVISVQKRLEVKQNSYKEQFKKINEKYAQSQNERQKAVIEYNNLLASIEANEKRNQLTSRDKERLLTEEKIKLAKKVDQLAEDLSQANEKIAEYKISLFENQVLSKKMVTKEQQSEARLALLSEQNKNIVYDNKAKEELIKSLIEQKEKLQKLLNEDKLNYKKKYNQILIETNDYRDKLDKAIKSSSNMQAKIAELEGRIEKQTRQKSALALKIEELKKIQQKYELEEENRQRKTETLSIQNMSQNQKIGEMKSKFEAEKKRFDQMETQYEEQVKYLVNSKEMIEHECEQLRWRLQKQSEQLQVMSFRNKELSQQIIQLSQKTIGFEERQLKNSQQFERKNALIKDLQQQQKRSNQKLKEVTQSLKEKEREILSLRKTGEDYSKQIRDLAIQRENKLQLVQDKEEKLSRAEELRSKQIKEKQKIISGLNIEIQSYKEAVDRMKQQIGMKTNELLTLKDSYKNISSDYSALLSKSEILKEGDQEKKIKIQQLEAEIADLHAEIKQHKRQLEKKASEFEEYKVGTIKGLEQFFNLLTKDPEDLKGDSIILLSIPDEKLSLLQMEAVKKYNSTLAKFKKQVGILTDSVGYFQNQLAKQQIYIDQLLEQHTQQLKRQNQKILDLSGQGFKKENQLKQKIQEMLASAEDKNSEIDYLNSEVRRYQIVIQQLNQTIANLSNDCCELKRTVGSLESDIFSLKEREIKEKQKSVAEVEEIRQLLVLQQERYRIMENNLSEELKVKEKIINDKIQEVRKWSLGEQEWKLEKGRLTEQSQQILEKYQSTSKRVELLERQLKQKEMKINKMQEQWALSQNNNDTLRERQIVLREELSKFKSQLQIISQQYQNFRKSQYQKNEESSELERKERNKRERVEISKAKLQEQLKEAQDKCIRLEGQIELLKFQKEDKVKKLVQYERSKEEVLAEQSKWRENAINNEREIHRLESLNLKLEHEKELFQQEKSTLEDENSNLKTKISEMDEKLLTAESTLIQVDSREKEISRLSSLLKANEEQYQKIVVELRMTLAKTKEGLNEKQSKIKELESFVEDRYNDISMEKLRLEKEAEQQKVEMRFKLEELEEKYQMVQEEYDFQKTQAIKEIEGANGIIQELNEVIREKQEAIVSKDELINQQNVRLEELTLQLHECVQKWQFEKESYLPTQEKMREINEELTRMNKFINDLDGRNKQLLEINRRKMQQKIQNKPPITELLKEVYGLLLKNKNKLLNRCQTDKEKESVIGEFKAVQQKLDLTLKSTQIVTVRQ